MIAVTTLAGAAGLSIGVGFVGAPAHQRFDWLLAAGVGTALGTLLLAGYTAWLATTTRQEVGLAIEEQRARDRPIIVATPQGIGAAPIDVTIGKTVPTLSVRVRNIGLGPALELRVGVTWPPNEGRGEETRAVWAVDQDEELLIPLSAWDEPGGGFRFEDLRVDGWYKDRSLAAELPVIALRDTGLQDEQRDAARTAMLRAHVYVSAGNIINHSASEIAYDAFVGNNGPGNARDVVLHLYRSEDRQPFLDPVSVGELRYNENTTARVTLPIPHPWLSCEVTWKDGLNRQPLQEFERIYPARTEPPPAPAAR